MVLTRVFVLLFFLSAANLSFGIDFIRVNVSWQYDPLCEIYVQHRTTQVDDLISVFLIVGGDSISEWNVELWKQNKYNSESHQLFDGVVVDTLRKTSKRIFTKMTFKKPTESLMVVKLSKFESVFYYDIPLKNGVLPFPSIYPVNNKSNLPILTNYINESEVKWLGSTTFYASSYKERFVEADPPMAKMKPLAPSVVADSSFSFASVNRFKDEYFYVIQKDSASAGGVTFLKTHPYFPELKKLEELVFAMQYLLNDTEKKGIQASRNLRQSFDSFWLNTYKTKFRARNAIRNYYNWVKQANHYFTDFKQGWKTDRGMLFIVYGVPDEVYRSENTEEWYYDQGPAFEFSIIATFFSSRTYALRRRIDLEQSWYDYIAAIRRGSNE
ncbi:MAG: GWxTD domain-containing protein [Bacteroidota bacterium]